MPRVDETKVQSAADAITTIDLERADALEAVATQFGVLAQVQEELDALRDPNRRDARVLQLRRVRKLVSVDG